MSSADAAILAPAGLSASQPPWLKCFYSTPAFLIVVGPAVLIVAEQLVEDNEISQMVVTAMLQSRGHKVHLASQGEEALKILDSKSFDLILLDIEMPVLDGPHTLQALRQNPERAPLPVIALTAHALKGDAEKYLALGFDDYLSKPLQPEDLDRILQRWL